VRSRRVMKPFDQLIASANKNRPSVQLEVESALVSLNRSRDAYAAAVEARKLGERNLSGMLGYGV